MTSCLLLFLLPILLFLVVVILPSTVFTLFNFVNYFLFSYSSTRSSGNICTVKSENDNILIALQLLCLANGVFNSYYLISSPFDFQSSVFSLFCTRYLHISNLRSWSYLSGGQIPVHTYRYVFDLSPMHVIQ